MTSRAMSTDTVKSRVGTVTLKVYQERADPQDLGGREKYELASEL